MLHNARGEVGVVRSCKKVTFQFCVALQVVQGSQISRKNLLHNTRMALAYALMCRMS